jgi:hypothetical protein
MTAFAGLAAGRQAVLCTTTEAGPSQLTKLISVTRNGSRKPPCQKAMSMITIDAHSRDMVRQSDDKGSTDVRCFTWACQLLHVLETSTSPNTHCASTTRHYGVRVPRQRLP